MGSRVSFARRFAGDRDGAVAVMAATFGMVAISCAALAVDMGSVFMQSRKLQGMADLAAIAAARDIGAAQAAASATVDANSWGQPVAVTVTPGIYEASSGQARDKRFTATPVTPNAAKVELRADADLFFAQAFMGKSKMPLVRSATAARAEFASFSIGSRLASLNGGVANTLLTALIGGQVSLSVMDQNALVQTDVDLFQYVGALRTAVNIQGASFDEALSVGMSSGQALSVLGDVLNANGDAAAGAAIKKIAVKAGNGTPVKLDALFDLGPAGAQDRLLAAKSASVKLKAMDVAGAILLVAQEGRQVKLDFGASVPGLTDIDVWLAIGERPNNSSWMAMARDGSVTIRTAQTRLYLEAKALSVLGVLGVKPLKVPVLVEAASAEAKLSAISCPISRTAQKVTLDVRPSVGSVQIGEIDTDKLNDFKHPLVVSPAAIIDLGLLQATASAKVDIGGQLWKPVAFTFADIENGVVKSVKTTDIAEASLTSLLGNLNIGVKLAGLPVLPAISLPLGNTVKALGAPLDVVLNDLTELIGVRLGEADVQVNGLRCRDAALVA